MHSPQQAIPEAIRALPDNDEIQLEMEANGEGPGSGQKKSTVKDLTHGLLYHTVPSFVEAHAIVLLFIILAMPFLYYVKTTCCEMARKSASMADPVVLDSRFDNDYSWIYSEGFSSYKPEFVEIGSNELTYMEKWEKFPIGMLDIHFWLPASSFGVFTSITAGIWLTYKDPDENGVPRLSPPTKEMIFGASPCRNLFCCQRLNTHV